MKKLNAFGIILLLILSLTSFQNIKSFSDRIDSVPLDTVIQQQSPVEISPAETSCDTNHCCKRHKKNIEVPVGKNPNTNSPDTVIINVKPEEVK